MENWAWLQRCIQEFARRKPRQFTNCDAIVMPTTRYVLEFSCENSDSHISFDITWNKTKYSSTEQSYRLQYLIRITFMMETIKNKMHDVAGHTSESQPQSQFATGKSNLTFSFLLESHERLICHIQRSPATNPAARAPWFGEKHGAEAHEGPSPHWGRWIWTL